MPALSIKASNDINASAAQIHATLVDLTTWPTWSPWLYIEPNAKVTYSGEKGQPGHGYQWSGEKVGVGGMTLSSITAQRIDYDLHFLKPFKSKARVWFELAELSPTYTTVSWHMDSSLPFFMFRKVDTMAGMIRGDYQRGLGLLKNYVEVGVTQSRTKVIGVENVSAIPYVGIQKVSAYDKMPSSMQETFKSLYKYKRNGVITSDGNAFCIYDRISFKKYEFTFTAAFPLEDPVKVSAPLVSNSIPACRALKAVHSGAYDHLANAWAMLLSQARSDKLKVSKSIPPFEFFLNSPDTALESELITELYLPLR